MKTERVRCLKFFLSPLFFLFFPPFLFFHLLPFCHWKRGKWRNYKNDKYFLFFGFIGNMEKFLKTPFFMKMSNFFKRPFFSNNFCFKCWPPLPSTKLWNLRGLQACCTTVTEPGLQNLQRVIGAIWKPKADR